MPVDKSLKELRQQVRKLQRPAGQMSRGELVKFIEMNGAETPRPEPAFVNKKEVKRITKARDEDSEIPMVEIYTEERGPAGITEPPKKAMTAKQAMIEQEIRQKLSSRKGFQKAEMQIVESKLREATQRDVESKGVAGGLGKYQELMSNIKKEFIESGETMPDFRTLQQLTSMRLQEIKSGKKESEKQGARAVKAARAAGRAAEKEAAAEAVMPSGKKAASVRTTDPSSQK